MTREQFERLKVGDKVLHAFGSIGVVTEKDDMTYVVKDKGFDQGDGLDEVSFAWNEGEPLHAWHKWPQERPTRTWEYLDGKTMNNKPKMNIKEMNKAVKKFFDNLDTMLENDKDIKVNSTEELVKEVDKIMEEQQ